MFKINIDYSDLTDLLDFDKKAIEATNEAAEEFARAIHGQIILKANEKLRGSREPYIEALNVYQESDGVWFITLDANMRWREDGMSPHSILDSLLKSPKAKTGKDGDKYLVVPFEHSGKDNTNTSSSEFDLISTIKSELDKAKIPYNKVEFNDKGRPKEGILHKLDFSKAAPNKKVGANLKGIQISQKVNKDAKGHESVKRAITTFRTASSKQTDKWNHPGVEAANLFEEALEWGDDHFENIVIPTLIDKILGSI